MFDNKTKMAGTSPKLATIFYPNLGFFLKKLADINTNFPTVCKILSPISQSSRFSLVYIFLPLYYTYNVTTVLEICTRLLKLKNSATPDFRLPVYNIAPSQAPRLFLKGAPTKTPQHKMPKKIFTLNPLHNSVLIISVFLCRSVSM